MNSAIVAGSIAAVAKRDGKSIAEHFLNVERVVLIDVSGSMAAEDSRGGRSRYNVACEELANLQAEFPGKLGIVAFSDGTVFVPGGVPPFIGGGTDLAGALRFAHVSDGIGAKFLVISDGQPNSPEDALAVAKTFTSKIDTCYVGPEEERGGADFLRRLAAASGGLHTTTDRVRDLAGALRPLLTASA